MASVTLKLSSRLSKDSGKAEVLLRYRNKRTIALRAHTHVFILPKFFVNGEIVIKNRLITPEVQDALDAKATIDRIVTTIEENGNKMPIEDFTLEWAQETIDKLLYPDKFEAPEPDKHCFDDKIEDFLKFKKISIQRHKSYRIIFEIVKRFELYIGKPINLDEATGDTLVALYLPKKG